LRSAQRFFIASDNRLLPSGVSPPRFLAFNVDGRDVAMLVFLAVRGEFAPSNAAMARLSLSLSCFKSATILCKSKIHSFPYCFASAAVTLLSMRAAAPNANTRHRFAVTRWRMVQSGANQSPLSNSLITRENTGNSCDSCLPRGTSHRKSLVFSGVFLEIPYSTEQGILKHEQGIIWAEQGIFFEQ
jgi:hypothetical protein